MLMLLLYLSCKKYILLAWSGILLYSKKKIKNGSYWIGFAFLFYSPVSVNAQNSQLHYKILFNGNDIGWMRLEKSTIGNKSVLSLVSEIKTKIIFSVTAYNKYVSTFENGKLINSFQLQKTNGSTKVDKETKLVKNGYEVTEDGEKEKLPYSVIHANLLSLYFQEPKTLKSVYWDKKQCFIKPIKTEDGGYQLKFSSGTSNCFYYNRDGICTKVKIEHLFYSAEIIYSN